MSKSSIALEITGLQAQLDSLKSLLSISEKVRKKKRKATSFAKLYGVWKGKVRLSFEEIREGEFRLPKNLAT